MNRELCQIRICVPTFYTDSEKVKECISVRGIFEMEDPNPKRKHRLSFQSERSVAAVSKHRHDRLTD